MFDFLKIFRSKSIFPVITVSIILFMIFFIFAFSVLQNYKKSQYREFRNEIAFVSEIKALQIASWYKGRISDGETVTNNPYIYREIFRFIEGNASREDTLKRLQWLEIFNIAGHYNDILITNAKGDFLLHKTKDLDSLSANTKDFLKKSLINKNLLFTDFYWCGYCEQYHLDMVCPIKDLAQNGKVKAFVIFRIDPNNIIFPFINYIDYKHKSMESFIIEKSDDSLLILNTPRLSTENSSHIQIPLVDSSSVEVKALLSKDGYVYGTDYRGQRTMLYVSHLLNPEWTMITKVDISEVEHLYVVISFIVYLFIFLFSLSLCIFFTSLWKNERLRKEKTDAILDMEKQLMMRKYDLLSKYANDIILIFDESLKIVDCNNRALEFYGYERKKFLSLTLRDIRYTYNVTDILFNEDDIAAGKVFETTHIKSNGDIVPIESSTRKVTINGKSFLHSIIRDITERKISESALKNSGDALEQKNRDLESSREELMAATEELHLQVDELLENRKQVGNLVLKLQMLENIITHSQIIAFRWKAEKGWPIVYVSENISSWGYSASDLMNSRFEYASLMDKDDALRVSSQLELDILNDSKEASYDYKIYTKSGAVRYVNERTIYEKSKDDVIDHYSGIVTDITEKKEIELMLASQASAMNAAMDGIAIIDSSGLYIYANDAFVKMMGHSSCKEIYGTLWLSHYPEELSKKIISLGIEEARKKGNWKGNLIATTKNGKVFKQDVSISILEEGGFILISRDATQRMTLEEELLQARKMDAIGKLAGGVAHDFNNMLSGIMGNAEMLEMKFGKNKDAVKYINNIISSSEHAAELTRQLLSFARKGKYQMKEISIRDLVNEVVNILSKTLNKNIKLIKNFNTKTDKIFADYSQMENALLNLALNARDAMPKGGTLSFESFEEFIDVTNSKEKGFAIDPGKYLLLKVSDTGEGIDEEILKHIFEPFYTTKEQGKGTGLGLASVYGTIKNHEGYISVSSRLKQGTVVSIYLPFFSSAQEIDEQTEMPLEGNPINVMIVDDDEMVCAVTAEMLKSENFTVYTFTETDAAYNFYKDNYNNVDIIIIDMILKDMNGKELFGKLKEINENAKGILTSGYETSEQIRNMLSVGLSGFLKKPFNKKDLVKIIRKSVNSENTI